ncbi:MAG: DUF4214 domain-containing protein [Firmicutes bacterium]|nr:DUF4214 domain-containing protein [Bacillota bacterium]
MAVNVDIYKYLYNYTKDRLSEYGEEIGYSQELFLLSTETEENAVDLLKIRDFENRDFMAAAYITLLQRVPDDKAYAVWEDKFEEEKSEFQKKVIKTIINSNEFRIKGMRIKNNYTEAVSSNDSDAAAMAAPTLSPALANMRKGRLFKIYSKFPYGVRVRLRKIFGVDK